MTEQWTLSTTPIEQPALISSSFSLFVIQFRRYLIQCWANNVSLSKCLKLSRKALAQGRTDHVTVLLTNFGLQVSIQVFFRQVLGTGFPDFTFTFSRQNNIFCCDLELWFMAFTYKLDLIGSRWSMCSKHFGQIITHFGNYNPYTQTYKQIHSRMTALWPQSARWQHLGKSSYLKHLKVHRQSRFRNTSSTTEFISIRCRDWPVE